MKRGFLLSDKKKLNIAVDPSLENKVEVKHEIFDAGMKMVKVDSSQDMDITIRFDSAGNIFTEHVASKGSESSKWEEWTFW